MNDIDSEPTNSQGARPSLTAEKKAARRELIRRSAEKMMSKRRQVQRVEEEHYPHNDHITREVEELVELGYSRADAVTSATRIYTRACFDKFIELTD